MEKCQTGEAYTRTGRITAVKNGVVAVVGRLLSLVV